MIWSPVTVVCFEIWISSRWCRYPDNKWLKDTLEAWLERQTQKFHFNAINSLAEKWHKCIELCGDYVEKQAVVRFTDITFHSHKYKTIGLPLVGFSIHSCNNTNKYLSLGYYYIHLISYYLLLQSFISLRKTVQSKETKFLKLVPLSVTWKMDLNLQLHFPIYSHSVHVPCDNNGLFLYKHTLTLLGLVGVKLVCMLANTSRHRMSSSTGDLCLLIYLQMAHLTHRRLCTGSQNRIRSRWEKV